VLIQKIKNIFQTRFGFILLLLLLYWAKTIFAYFIDFNLIMEKPFQYVILLINPIATGLLLLGIALYIKNTRAFYITAFVIYFLMLLLLFSNAVYYREFSDYITINTILGSSKVASGLGESAIRLFRFWDIVYFIDLLGFLLLKITKHFPVDVKPFNKRAAFAITWLSVLIFSANLFLAETDRPELITRTFSRDYLVKYLGLNAFTSYDAIQTYNTNQIRAKASPRDLTDVTNYVKAHYAAPDPKYFGKAKGKNVIYIHLESFQQFLIDYKLKDENGVEHEVTPFLNSLYHSNETYAFDNFFNQVKAGKTSDAETMFENSLFGLDQGSLFTQLGGKNTFEAAPSILNQTQGYTSAVFHGNAGTFWNRTETYKQFGFNYFFDASYFDVTSKNSFQYGIHDKPFFEQSVRYLEHLQQPFYTKFITVSNHYPYEQFTNDEGGFPLAQTKDETINGYFATANYLDTAVKEFFDYLKASGLYNNSIIVLYGDHYGISNSRNPSLAPLLGMDSETWADYNNAMMQRVPYMIVNPNDTDGHINHTYGGEIDALPTLLHLLGVDTTKYLQLGQDLLSPAHQQIVAFRNDNFVSQNFTVLGDKVYNTQNGIEITNPDASTQEVITKEKEAVAQQLSISDQINNGDLLRFYKDSGLDAVDPSKFKYKDGLGQAEKIEKDKGSKSTSLFSENGNKTTQYLFHTQTYKELHPEEETTNK
jgi:lipoteichoic acid synthase